MTSRILLSIFALATASAQRAPTDVPGVVNTYCAGCHNGTTKSPSGVLLTKFDPNHISDDRETWSRVSRMLRAGAMPPAGAPRPDQLTYDRTLAIIDRALAGPPLEAESSANIATRLATVLWNSSPDAALLKDASSNRLNQSTVLEAQVRRMLADPKAEAFVTNFFFTWLQFDRLSTVDQKLYPEYSDALRADMLRETQQFLMSQVREDRDPIELWTANYTFLNERLAKHYGAPELKGPELRRVEWRDNPNRAGLLGQGSILTLTSRLDSPYTSPAARSTWVLRHYYGIAPPNPFPGARPVKPELPITPQTRTLPDNPCGTCHANFFPLGYALENFDPLGRWRTHDQAGTADASGTFVDGRYFAKPTEFRKGLVRHADAFRTTITESLLIFASGQPVKPAQGTADTLAAARQILNSQPHPHWTAIIAAAIRSKSPAVE